VPPHLLIAQSIDADATMQENYFPVQRHLIML